MDSFARLPLADFLAHLASRNPTPGGGAAASATGALAAALAQMVVAYSVGKKSLAAHEPSLRDAISRLERAREVLLRLADEDAAAYGAVSHLMKLPEDDPRRRAEWPEAVRACVQAPVAVAAACADLLRLFESLPGITNRQLRSDLGIAAVLAEAACRASRWNVEVNAPLLPEGERGPTLAACDALVRDAVRLAGAVERECGPETS